MHGKFTTSNIIPTITAAASQASLTRDENDAASAEHESSLSVQTKLSVGDVDDPLEDEADTMADTIMRMPDTNFVQRKCSECAKEDEEKIHRKPLASFVQRKSEGSGAKVSDTVSASLKSSKGAGHNMDNDTASFMESRFGTAFSEVKIHTGPEAVQMSRDLNAKAFTHGSDIYFNEGQYRPGSSEGNHLLAHELTHTIQQGGSSSLVQRAPFSPWPKQAGEDVPKTFTDNNGVLSERVQRHGDPNFSDGMPSLLEFNPNTCTLTATMDIKFIPEAKVANQLSAADFTALKKKILDVGNSRLNGWVTIKAGDQKECPANCKGKNITVNVVAREGNGTDATEVVLGKNYDREDAGHIGKSASEWTIWHEMGHIVLDAPDEYPEKGRPDERVNESDFSIMASSSSFGRFGMMHARHFWHMSEWLKRKFPGCSFEVVETDRPMIIDWNFSVNIGGFGGQTGGFFMSTGIDMGIPFDKMRRFSLLLGPRLTYTLQGDTSMALLAGFRAGLRFRTTGEFGFQGTVFGEGGGVGFTDLSKGKFGAAPYAEGGVSLGFHNLNSFNLSIEGAMGGRTATLNDPLPGLGRGTTTEFQKYYRLGLSIGTTF